MSVITPPVCYIILTKRFLRAYLVRKGKSTSRRTIAMSSLAQRAFALISQQNIHKTYKLFQR